MGGKVKAVFELLCQLFNTIGINYNEDENNVGSWYFIETKKIPMMNYNAFEIYLIVNFNSFFDYVELINPSFEQLMEESGISIREQLYRANSQTTEFRLYLEQLKDVE